jgi:hypothetical protein
VLRRATRSGSSPRRRFCRRPSDEVCAREPDSAGVVGCEHDDSIRGRVLRAARLHRDRSIPDAGVPNVGECFSGEVFPNGVRLAGGLPDARGVTLLPGAKPGRAPELLAGQRQHMAAVPDTSRILSLPVGILRELSAGSTDRVAWLRTVASLSLRATDRLLSRRAGLGGSSELAVVSDVVPVHAVCRAGTLSRWLRQVSLFFCCFPRCRG